MPQKTLTMTVNQLHKALGKLIEKGEKRTQVCIDKTSFTHPLESDGCQILNVDGLKVECVLQMQDDGGTLDSSGNERFKRSCILFGGSGQASLPALSIPSVEDFIKRIEWSKDTPNIHKTLVAGNIRNFAQEMRRIISGEGD
jgi:hypothetical protein